MVPKSKRAKRRNRRRESNGYALYQWFRFLEKQDYYNDVVVKDWKYRIFAYFLPIRVTMVGGVVKHG